MELATIQMPKEEAKAALEEYRAAVRASGERVVSTIEGRAARRRAELEQQDKRIVAGYELIAKGRSIISLRDTLAAGGEDEHHRPRLAVARADEKTIDLRRFAAGRVDFDPVRPGWGDPFENIPWNSNRAFSFMGMLPPIESRNVIEARAIVPHIPPGLRPDALDRYHVLWEADWTRRQPVDPALLRRVLGDLYVVVATWDLTDLERAVLNG